MLNKHISHGARFALLGVLLLSGANGLVMEIVFRRQLLLSLGVTHYSVGMVLTVFMAGLALGSFLFGRMSDTIEYPIKLYGLLEVLQVREIMSGRYLEVETRVGGDRWRSTHLTSYRVPSRGARVKCGACDGKGWVEAVEASS